MKLNDVFTVDQATIDELKLTCKLKDVEQPVTAGQQYRISQPPNSVEVRASRVVDGKPQKGRPRRFPTAVVARLMGVPVPTTPAPVSDEDATIEGDAPTAEPEALTPETPVASKTPEEQEKSAAELSRAIGLPADDNSW